MTIHLKFRCVVFKFLGSYGQSEVSHRFCFQIQDLVKDVEIRAAIFVWHKVVDNRWRRARFTKQNKLQFAECRNSQHFHVMNYML